MPRWPASFQQIAIDDEDGELERTRVGVFGEVTCSKVRKLVKRP